VIVDDKRREFATSSITPHDKWEKQSPVEEDVRAGGRCRRCHDRAGLARGEDAQRESQLSYRRVPDRLMSSAF